MASPANGAGSQNGACDSMYQERTLRWGSGLTGMVTCCILIVASWGRVEAETPSLDLKIEQVTSGTKHHFFGAIGQCQTIPCNGDNRYLVGMEIEHIDRMPKPREAATVILVATPFALGLRLSPLKFAPRPREI